MWRILSSDDARPSPRQVLRGWIGQKHAPVWGSYPQKEARGQRQFGALVKPLGTQEDMMQVIDLIGLYANAATVDLSGEIPEPV